MEREDPSACRCLRKWAYCSSEHAEINAPMHAWTHGICIDAYTQTFTHTHVDLFVFVDRYVHIHVFVCAFLSPSLFLSLSLCLSLSLALSPSVSRLQRMVLQLKPTPLWGTLGATILQNTHPLTCVYVCVYCAVEKWVPSATSTSLSDLSDMRVVGPGLG